MPYVIPVNTSYPIRIPNATDTQDGVMSSQQAAQLGALSAWRMLQAATPSPSRNFVSLAPLLDGRALIVSGRPTGGSQICSNLVAAAKAGDMVITVNDVSIFNRDAADLPTAMGISLAFSNGRAAENILVTAINPANNTLTLANPLVGNYTVGTAVGYIRNQEALASTQIFSGGSSAPTFTAGPAIPPIGSGATANVNLAYAGGTSIVVDDITPFPTTGFPYPVEIWNTGPGTTFYANVAAVSAVDVPSKTLTLTWALPAGPPSPVPGAGNTGVTVGTKIKVSARRPGCGVVTLADGRVLIFGGGTAGFGQGGVPYAFHASSWIYNPADGSMTRTGDMPTGWITWNGPEAGGVLLDDGRVFVCGNPTSDKSNPAGTEPCSPTDVGYIYTPSTGTWASTYDGITANKKMSTVRNYHSFVKLQNGKVFIAGGSTSFYPNKTAGTWLSSCEIFDPVAGTFSLAADMNTISNLIDPAEAARSWINIAVLDSGKVLVNGGFWRKATDFVTTPAGTNGLAQKPLVRLSNNAAVYDPTQNSWTAVRSSNLGNAEGRLFRLSSSQFLRSYASSFSGQTDVRCEVYDPTQNIWTYGVSDVPDRGTRRIETTITAQAAAGQPNLVVSDLTDWLSTSDVSYMAAAQFVTITDGVNTETIEILSVVTGTKTVTLVSNLVNTYASGATVVFSNSLDQIKVPIIHVNHRTRTIQLAGGQILVVGPGNNVKSWPQSTLGVAALAGATTIALASAAKLPTSNLSYQRILLGTSGATNEVRKIVGIDLNSNTVQLDQPLLNNHPAGESVRMMTDTRFAMLYTP